MVVGGGGWDLGGRRSHSGVINQARTIVVGLSYLNRSGWDRQIVFVFFNRKYVSIMYA